MKIKVEYVLPRVVVSENIEVGKITNSTLNKRQGKLVDACLLRIAPELNKKIDSLKPQVKIKMS